MLAGRKTFPNWTLLYAAKSSTCNEIFYAGIFPAALCTIGLASEYWKEFFPFLLDTKTCF